MMRIGVAVTIVVLLHSVLAGAAEPLEWSHRLGGEGGAWDPLFEPTGETWLQREFGSMLREVRAYADPPGCTRAWINHMRGFLAHNQLHKLQCDRIRGAFRNNRLFPRNIKTIWNDF